MFSKIDSGPLETLVTIGSLIFLFVAHWRTTTNKKPRSDPLQIAMTILFLVGSLFFVVIALRGARMSLIAAVLLVMQIGVCTFIVIGEAMVWGLARKLTESRGEKWTKELDYIYLALGTIGLVAAVNRIDAVDGRIQGYDILGSVVLGIAIAVRLIRTRAEVEEWNKLPTTSAPEK